LQNDPELRAVATAWPELPDAIKAGIVATVQVGVRLLMPESRWLGWISGCNRGRMGAYRSIVMHGARFALRVWPVSTRTGVRRVFHVLLFLQEE